MKKRCVPIFTTHITRKTIKAVKDTLKSGWINIGEGTERFERSFCRTFESKYAVALNSCTSALRLSYSIAGVEPSTEVITTPFTMIATNTPILEQFGKPIFADVQYGTGNIDPYDIEHRITKKTRAITCMHSTGYPCDIDELRKIADDNNLPLIEDCAHALGATYHSKIIGSESTFACFSFHTVKHITTGDGGMLVTHDPYIYDEALKKSWFGMDRRIRQHDGKFPDISELGYKMRMNALTASMGLAQLDDVADILAQREINATILREELENVKGVRMMDYKVDRLSSNYLFPIHVKQRHGFIRHMNEYGIGVYLQNERNDRFTLFGGLRKDLPNLDRIDKDFICLPCHQDLTYKDIDYMIEVVKRGW